MRFNAGLCVASSADLCQKLEELVFELHHEAGQTKTGVLSLSTVGFGSQRAPSCGGLVLCIPGLYPPDGLSTPSPPTVTTKNVSRYYEVSSGGLVHLQMRTAELRSRRLDVFAQVSATLLSLSLSPVPG